LRSLLLQLASLVLCVVLAGCAARVDVAATSGSAQQVTLTSTVAVVSCSDNAQGTIVTQTCRFADVGGAATTTVANFSGLSPEDDVQSIPVIVLELPQGATDVVASYDNGRGSAGRMLVTSALSVLPLDSVSSLVAEPGMQLVVLELPGGIGADVYTMTVSYQAPSMQLKTLAATKLTASGSTYYAPILPCARGFEALPLVPITGTVPALDVRNIASAFIACSGDTYTYTSLPPPRSVKVTVYEYYNRSLDHYFITWVPAELDALDGGTIRGWQRTGASFSAYLTPEAGTSAVCRYYMPPPYGDSHFFGRGAKECADTGARNPAFVLEDPAFMYIALPNAGACAPGTQPIYRVFSNRADANHRYMTDPALRDAMVASGWMAEGDGPDLIVMCAPS